MNTSSNRKPPKKNRSAIIAKLLPLATLMLASLKDQPEMVIGFVLVIVGLALILNGKA